MSTLLAYTFLIELKKHEPIEYNSESVAKDIETDDDDCSTGQNG